MMEFTLSRCILMVCGIILVGAVAVPVSDGFESENRADFQELADRDAELIDSYLSKNIDEIYLDGSVLLPDCTFSLSVSGHELVLEDREGNRYVSYVNQECREIRLSFGDRLVIGNAPQSEPFTKK